MSKHTSQDVIMRAKLGPSYKAAVQEDDRVSIPSQISDDMWGEVPKYQALVVQEQIRKEREAFEQKRKMVRKTLDEQVEAFNKVRANQKQKDKDMDKMILERAQQEIQQDKAKKEALIKKTLDAKQVME